MIDKHSEPFDHWVIDDFLSDEVALELAKDFYDLNDDRWLTHHANAVEHKQLSNHWDKFPASIYRLFQHLNSPLFVEFLAALTGIKGLRADYGLHAGGMHIHDNRGGRLNLHKDAEVHPKLGLKRKLNLIIYLNPNWEESWGGALEFWSNDPETGTPLEKVKEIYPLFNRVVLFDTTQNSWHGLPNEYAIHSPDGEYRKSLALFYYIENEEPTEDQTKRARFAPTDTQKADPEVLAFISERLAWTTS